MGSGKLTLEGTNSYTGSTSVISGTLVIRGSVTNTTSLTVAAGAQLHVSGQLYSTGNIINNGTLVFTDFGQFGAGGTIINNGTIINKATFLTLPNIDNHGAILQTPPAITSASTVAGVNGMEFSYQITASRRATTFGATGLPAGLGVNTRTGLIWGTPTVTGTFNPTISANSPYRTGTATLTINVLPPGAKTWTGAVSDRWDTATANWAGATTRFSNSDNVILAGGARTTAVAMAPGIMVTNAILNPTATRYSLRGMLACNGSIVQNTPGAVDFGAALSGSGGVTVNSGILVLSATNTYRGPTAVNGGVLKAGNSRCLSGASLLTLNSGGVLDLNGINLEAPRQLILNGGTILNSGTCGQINWPAITAYSGTIATAINGELKLTKTTGGTILISSTMSYWGTSTINEGTFKLAGYTKMKVVVNRSGTFIQTGKVDEQTVTINNGGIYGPGDLPSLRLFNGSGGLVIKPGGIVEMLIQGTKTAGIDYDQILMPDQSNLLTLGGCLVLTAPTPLPVGGVYTLISYRGSGPVNGMFDRMPEGAQFLQSNQWWRISYVGGKGHDVTVTRVNGDRLR